MDIDIDGYRCNNCGLENIKYTAKYKNSSDNDRYAIATFCSNACNEEYWYNNKSIGDEVEEKKDIITVSRVNLNDHNFTKDEMGRAGWLMLHARANNYPDEPTEEERNNMEMYMVGFGKTYPCKMCREHFLEMFEEYPPNYTSKTTLKYTVCKWHNIVNNRLGKLMIPCQCMEDVLSSYVCVDDM